jgi:acyl-CoA thioester hydrolase
MARTDFQFFNRLRVRWAEVDAQGVVFNGNYLLYFDVSMTEYWRAIGYPYPGDLVAMGADQFVKKAMVEYHAAARYDEELDVGVRCARIGRSSLQFLLEVYRDDTLLTQGELIYVSADPATHKSTAVPEFLRAAIRGFEKTAPQES